MTRILLIAIAGACSFSAAGAGDAYVGASYLNGSADLQTSLTQTTDSSSTGWKVFGGYNFVKYLGVELTYYDLGSFSESTSMSSTRADVAVWDASFRGILPLGKWFELFGRLGYSSVETDFQRTGLFNVSRSSRDWELLYGIGAAVNLGSRFGIRAEWEAWDNEASLNAWSVGVFFRFGGR